MRAEGGVPQATTVAPADHAHVAASNPSGSAVSRRLQTLWWRGSPTSTADALILGLLWPLAACYGLARALVALPWRLGWRRPEALPVPLVVVGNLIVGGAGKTPVVIALVEALRSRGWTPGVVSRGYGGREGRTAGPRAVRPSDDASQVGDEPLLVARRTSAPVWVGRRRPAAVHALCAAHPEVDVVISDDGLQHHALHRDAQWIVFDERGVGNGRLLPAGPLREPLPAHPPADTQVVYTCDQPSTSMPGRCASRRLGGLVPLSGWWRGQPARHDALAALHGQPVHAAAGIGHPARFFEMLAAGGLRVTGIALPDHASLQPRPWPADATCVIVTEKDAVKLPADGAGTEAVQVATLDLRLPDDLVAHLCQRLQRLRRR